MVVVVVGTATANKRTFVARKSAIATVVVVVVVVMLLVMMCMRATATPATAAATATMVLVVRRRIDRVLQVLLRRRGFLAKLQRQFAVTHRFLSIWGHRDFILARSLLLLTLQTSLPLSVRLDRETATTPPDWRAAATRWQCD